MGFLHCSICPYVEIKKLWNTSLVPIQWAKPHDATKMPQLLCVKLEDPKKFTSQALRRSRAVIHLGLAVRQSAPIDRLCPTAARRFPVPGGWKPDQSSHQRARCTWGWEWFVPSRAVPDSMTKSQKTKSQKTKSQKTISQKTKSQMDKSQEDKSQIS